MPHNPETFPALTTNRLELIETEPFHASDMFRLFTDKRVTEFYTVVPIKDEQDLLPLIESFKIRLKEKQAIRWGIALKGNKDIIGTIGFHSYNEGHKGSLLFALMPEYQNKGYATEAIQAVLKFGSETLGLTRIEAEVMPGNTASEKVLEKTGFTHESLLPNGMLWDGQYYDINMYSITLGQ